MVRELTVREVLALQKMDFDSPLVVDYFLSNIVLSGDYNDINIIEMLKEVNPTVFGTVEPDKMPEEVQEQRRTHANKQLMQQVLSVMRDYPFVLDMSFEMYTVLIESLQ